MSTVVIHDLSPDDAAALKLACKRSKLREPLALREVLRAGISVAFGGDVPTKAKARAEAKRQAAREARKRAQEAVAAAALADKEARAAAMAEKKVLEGQDA